MKKEKKIEKNNTVTKQTGFQLDIPVIGVGRMRTTASYVALLLLTENPRVQRLDVINSILKEMKIYHEELIHLTKHPDVLDEVALAKWQAEYTDIKKRLGVEE